MALGEKISTLRKKAGLSQVDLADKFSVSRQAVSKWETGEAVPEIAKLVALAREFGVSVDYLVSDDAAPSGPEQPAPQVSPQSAPEKRTLRNILRRLGWRTGVYTAFGGTILSGIGVLMHYIDNRIFESFMSQFSSFTPFSIHSDIEDFVSLNLDTGKHMTVGFVVPLQELRELYAAGNPVVMIGSILTWGGLALAIAGIVLAVVLYRYSHLDKLEK